ncbi:MAG: hypothetical protein OEY79_04085 [Anaplasmataceae bacterium]|nr:hypothetical protein [Anaplasmataceae bacterium]
MQGSRTQPQEKRQASRKRKNDDSLTELSAKEIDELQERKKYREALKEARKKGVEISYFILRAYAGKKDIDIQECEPIYNPEEPAAAQLMASIEKWLKVANKPFDARGENEGIFYPGDYIKHVRKNHEKQLDQEQEARDIIVCDQGQEDTTDCSDDYIRYLRGLYRGECKDLNICDQSFYTFCSNPKYWDTYEKKSCGLFFQATDKDYTPSQRLAAFFEGPTVADCGSVLQACCYKGLEELMGTKAFNEHFKDGFKITGVPLKKGVNNPFDGLLKSSPHKDDFLLSSILWIEGVAGYNEKHIYGLAEGWYAICTGQNEAREDLFLAYDPDKLQEARTFEQMKKIAIDYYNEDQSSATLSLLDGNINKKNKREIVRYYDDTIDYSHNIGGISCSRRFDEEKLKDLFTKYSALVPTELTDVEEEQLSRVIPDHFLSPEVRKRRDSSVSYDSGFSGVRQN